MPCFRGFLSTFKNRICIQWYLYLIVFRVVLRKKDDKALRLWRVLFLGFFSIFPIHKSLCISWKHMKSARKRATALVLKSKRDDSIIDPLKKKGFWTVVVIVWFLARVDRKPLAARSLPRARPMDRFSLCQSHCT